MSNVQNPNSSPTRRFLRLALRAAKILKASFMSNKFIEGLLYDDSNMEQFSDLNLHEDMLADLARVDTYADGIRRHVKQGDVVVDLGTGTGILAMLAARQGAKVYAIDHSEIVGVAERIAKHNGIDTINFLKTQSKDFVCPEKVDILLHEQMGRCLFEENMVENLLDLKQRLLKDTGRILPARFELFLEPVRLKEGFRIPFIQELSVQGFNFAFMENLPELEKYKPGSYLFPFIEADAVDFFLSTPQSILQFDLNNLTGLHDIPTSLEASRTVVEAGRLDGLCLFFRVLFDGDIQLTTAPDQPRTNWGNRMFRTLGKDFAVGDVITYTLTFDNLREPNTWSVSIMYVRRQMNSDKSGQEKKETSPLFLP